jgi:hypothetical protein
MADQVSRDTAAWAVADRLADPEGAMSAKQLAQLTSNIKGAMEAKIRIFFMKAMVSWRSNLATIKALPSG